LRKLPGHYHRSQSKKRRKDISIITYGAAVYKCLEAANELAKIGIEAEVVDLRVLRPMDEATFLASVSKTRAIIVEEAWRSVSISAEVSARIMVFYDLDVPVQRLCGAEVPIPYANHLEERLFLR
jgi:pyruvate dehydrogenase E1 component beta subunit